MKSDLNLLQFSVELQEARDRTLRLVADLDDRQMIGPRLDIVNPLRWEIGHVAWFQEYWVLRHLNGRKPILAGGDTLYDSANVGHETRWELSLPSKAETMKYMQQILDQVLDQYDQGVSYGARGLNNDAAYFLSVVLFHEDMHAEAITYTRQRLRYSAPQFSVPYARRKPCVDNEQGEKLGDAFIPGGTFLMGSTSAQPFTFDNEMSAHQVTVEPFSISWTAVADA